MENYNFRQQWLDICDKANTRIERALHKDNVQEAFKWLNLMDLLCTETAAYWRETGLDMYDVKMARRNDNNTKSRKMDLGKLVHRQEETISIL